ncbi:MAG: tetratricopeptide repeat protein [Bryobacteraceae bacterium]
MWLPRLHGLRALVLLPAFLLVPSLSQAARDNWTELNIGPFYLDTQGDLGRARDILTELEQVRWVLGGLLEQKELGAAWPFRVIVTDVIEKGANCTFISRPAAGTPGAQAYKPFGFVSQAEEPIFQWENAVVLHSQYTVICPTAARPPLGQVAALMLDANTVRLPADVESGLEQLFDTLEANGSRVTWGGTPAHLDLATARMMLFATKFDYAASFHIFITALKGGSSLRSAETNAFGRPTDELEKEAEDIVSSNKWPSASVSGRPLNPKRDFGEHSVPDTEIEVYLADAKLPGDTKTARLAYEAAVKAGGGAAPLGYEGLAQLAVLENADMTKYLDSAAQAGSRSAPVYFASAEDLPTERLIALLKKAATLNPRWAEPVFRQAQETEDKGEREALIKKATQINPRETKYWIELAKAQVANGHAAVAQGSWLRAEESAATDKARDEVHQMRMENESARLDAAEKARRDERDAAHLADQRAQQSEADRIKAAEAKANAALDAESGGSAPAEVVPWNQVVPKKEIRGQLVGVECMGKNARLRVKDAKSRESSLLLRNVSEAGLACGTQNPPLRVTVTYSAQPDETLRIDGTVLSLETRSSR